LQEKLLQNVFSSSKKMLNQMKIIKNHDPRSGREAARNVPAAQLKKPADQRA
jgi:hypothetical protein